jgi:hypothetical protein
MFGMIRPPGAAAGRSLAGLKAAAKIRHRLEPPRLQPARCRSDHLRYQKDKRKFRIKISCLLDSTTGSTTPADAKLVVDVVSDRSLCLGVVAGRRGRQI